MKPGTHFPGVGAGLVIQRNGKVLLYKRENPPEAGHWSIVGGKVDHMETAASAAKREAEEETGLSIGDTHFLCVSEQIIPSDSQHWISLIYLADKVDGEARLMEPEKLSDMGWFDLDDLPQPLSLFAKDAFRHLRNSRGSEQ